jgi:hypothetical protein
VIVIQEVSFVFDFAVAFAQEVSFAFDFAVAVALLLIWKESF